MPWKKREAKHPWKSYLTKEEAASIEALERDAQKTDAQRRAITVERNRIVNRAIHRAKYAEAK
jgi:hypothetical protein